MFLVCVCVCLFVFVVCFFHSVDHTVVTVLILVILLSEVAMRRVLLACCKRAEVSVK